jgi:hypothetical protein
MPPRRMLSGQSDANQSRVSATFASGLRAVTRQKDLGAAAARDA